MTMVFMKMTKNMEEKFDTTGLDKAITRTIAFFDMFDFPLTAFEVWKYCEIGCSLFGIMNSLDIKKEKVETKNGFYFLEGREKIVNTRMKRYNVASEKFKKAIWVSRFFRLIPWIKMIAVGNIIGGNNAKEEGDIDFFIITEKGRIWISRFFSVGIIKLFGLRPEKGNIKNKICLSFFIAENELNVERLCLENGDDYFLYWVANLVPVYDQGNFYEKFIRENQWFRNRLPNWKPAMVVSRRKTKKLFSNFYHDIVDVFLGGLDRIFKKIQIKIFPHELREEMNKDTRVVVNDNILKFHSNDRRVSYQTQYEEKINEIFR